MTDKNISKGFDKYTTLGYKGANGLIKVNKDFIKQNSKYFEDLKLKKMKQGFLGYDEWLRIEGLNISSIEEIKLRIFKEITEIVKKLEKGKIYSLLLNAYPVNNRRKILAVLPYSIFIYEKTDIMVLTNILIKYLIIHINKYEYEEAINLKFLIREWYTKENLEIQVNEIKNRHDVESDKKYLDLNSKNLFNSLIDSVNADLVSKKIEIDEKLNLNSNNYDYIKHRIKNLRRNCIVFRLNQYVIQNLRIINGDFNYTLYSLDVFKFLFFDKKSITESNINYDYSLLEIYDKSDQPVYIKYFIIQSKKIKNEFDLISISSEIIYSWTDLINYNTNLITRFYLDNKIEFALSLYLKKRKNLIKNVELEYNFPNLLEMRKDYIWDKKIGVIDLETLQINNEGEQCVFAGGWAVSDYIFTEYLDKSKYKIGKVLGKESKLVEGLDDNDSELVLNSFKLASYELIKNLFDSIFSSKYNDYTFYMHNLGGFDYIFILSALSYYNNEYLLVPLIKEDNNLLVSLKISKFVEVNNTGEKGVKSETKVKKKKLVRKTIKILDSNQIIPGKLRNLAKEFNCKELKGHFPYKFININNLDYKGELPPYYYFSDSLGLDEYNNWKSSIKVKKRISYDIKKEAIKYLKHDLYALLEVVNKYSNFIFKNFGINITKINTLSGLALKIYLSSFYKYKYNFKLIKGKIESDIRKAYFGGLVLTKLNYIHKTKAYVYDVNSHYPNAMLEDIPVGNPVLSLSKDLNSYFGFCYAEIIPPKNLDFYFIPLRDENGKIITPNYSFKGIYFSELLKESIHYGYKINVLWGYKFNRGQNVFKNYVDEMYNGRLKAKLDKNNSLQFIFKLLLNSLYGRLGMKDIENRLKILSREEANKFITNKNIVFYSELHDKIILRYNNNVNKEIIKFTDLTEKSNTFVDKIKQRGVISSIPIAAAITSWALIKLLKFLNMNDNKLIYCDTDSITLEKPLDDKYISSTELGKFKLEFIINEGIYISPKFYGLNCDNGETIIKTKGIAKGKIKYQDLEKLIKGENLNITTTIFKKNLVKGTVNIVEQIYTIKGKLEE